MANTSIMVVEFIAHFPEGFDINGTYTTHFHSETEARSFIRDVAEPAWSAHSEKLGGRIVTVHRLLTYDRLPGVAHAV